jgi:uncharacterized membrane protein YeaQ/YmgE (transglycosylase-associated protein family)
LADRRCDRRLACGSDRQGGGFGLLGNIVIGIVGAVVAGWLLPQLGIRLGTGIVAAIINSAIGGVIVLVILSLIRRA